MISITGFTGSRVHDRDASSENTVAGAYRYIVQILCNNDTTSEPKRKTLEILWKNVPTPSCISKQVHSPELNCDYRIYLNYSQFCWCQMIYQLSHEVNHMIMQCAPIHREYQWISEVICEMASQIVLGRMSQKQRNGYYPGRGDLEFEKYIAEHEARFFNSSTRQQTPHDYLASVESSLKDPEYLDNDLRIRNCKLAFWLLQRVVFSPRAWQAVTYVKNIDTSDTPSYSEFFRRWLIQCHDNITHSFVETIAVTLYPDF